jgi:hypothetical protein
MGLMRLGPWPFVPMILGQMTNISYFVGGKFDIEPLVADAGHFLYFEIGSDHKTSVIVVGIRLFASCATPSYHVVVGTADGIPQLLAS